MEGSGVKNCWRGRGRRPSAGMRPRKLAQRHAALAAPASRLPPRPSLPPAPVAPRLPRHLVAGLRRAAAPERLVQLWQVGLLHAAVALLLQLERLGEAARCDERGMEAGTRAGAPFSSERATRTHLPHRASSYPVRRDRRPARLTRAATNTLPPTPKTRTQSRRSSTPRAPAAACGARWGRTSPRSGRRRPSGLPA